MRHLSGLTLFLVALGGVSANAQTPAELSADRPGFAEATDTVPTRSFQIEGGFLVDADTADKGTVHRLLLPQTLLRGGLTQRIELRLSSDGYVWQRAGISNGSAGSSNASSRIEGLSDLVVGTKIHLREARGWRPALAIVAAVSLPTGASALTSSGADPLVKVDWSGTLPGDIGLGGSLAIGSRTVGSDRQTTNALSIGLTHGLPASLDGFAEIYRLGASGDEASWTVDGGVSRLLGTRTQVDLSGGHTVNRNSHYWFVSGGISVRL